MSLPIAIFTLGPNVRALLHFEINYNINNYNKQAKYYYTLMCYMPALCSRFLSYNNTVFCS